jgi:hypothetical protein
MRTGLAWFRINPVVDFCEHGHEIIVFLTADFFDQLVYYQFLNTNVFMYFKSRTETLFQAEQSLPQLAVQSLSQ